MTLRSKKLAWAFFIASLVSGHVFCAQVFAADAAISSTPDVPPPPPGYRSKATLMAALATKQLPLIKADEPVPADVNEITDIEYGRIGDRALKLDLALPKQVKGPMPGLIFIHGGAWKGGDRKIYHYYTRRFAQKGYAAATISYRLTGEAIYPAAVQDAKCAVRWMRANANEYGIDPNRLVAIGGSAGGHLSMMIGYSDDPQLEGEGGHQGVSSRVAAVINFYGPVDLTSEEGQKADVVQKFLGGPYNEKQDIYRQASPFTHLDAKDPPTLVIHGTLDDIVSISQADLLVGRLRELKVPHSYARLEGWPHTLDAAEPVNQYCQQLMLQFLETNLQTAP